MASIQPKPARRQREIWPFDDDLTVALAFMVAVYVGFAAGWFAAGGAL